jgi:hypothetical protein
MQIFDLTKVGAILDTLRVKELLMGVSDRQGRIARLLDSGGLIALRRGLYATRRDIDPLCLAASIYGPSYISFETALSWHGMIPESVIEILSATLKRPASFENEFGRFRYLGIPAAVYPVGIMRVADGEIPFLIASPTKSLCDAIAREAGFRSMADVRHWLEGMRINPSIPLDSNELQNCADSYGRPSVRWLLRYAAKHQLCST